MLQQCCSSAQQRVFSSQQTSDLQSYVPGGSIESSNSARLRESGSQARPTLAAHASVVVAPLPCILQLGGKGANLAEMSRIGLSVPPGLTITTETCAEFDKLGTLPVTRTSWSHNATAMLQHKRRTASRRPDMRCVWVSRQGGLNLSAEAGVRATRVSVLDQTCVRVIT